MGRETLKVMDDFYRPDFKVGDIIGLFEGKVKVLDLNYQNEFGSFILCEYIEVEADNHDSVRNTGKPAHPDNLYKVIGTIHIPGYRNLLGGIGFFIKDRNSNGIIGLTYQQTWKLIFQEGAVNAEASESKYGMFHSTLIDSIQGLPSLDSTYWKIPAYDRTGNPFARFTKEALAEIKKGIKYAVRNRVRDNNNARKIEDNDPSELDDVAELIRKAEKIAVFAGAGLSTSSGIPDYRSLTEGLWRKHPSLQNDLRKLSFKNDPERFWHSFYKLIEYSLSPIVPFPTEPALLATLDAIEPNEGHRFFTWLETEMGKSVTVITQNVDDLERKAGMKNVIQMHGNILECICPTCQKTYPLHKVLKKNLVPKCACQAVLRPNAVFFGDEVHDFTEAEEVVESVDLLLIAGTSLEVYPFNLLPYSKNGAPAVLLNKTSNNFHSLDYTLIGEISMICRKLKEKLGASLS